jgi:hypothetical protein
VRDKHTVDPTQKGALRTILGVSYSSGKGKEHGSGGDHLSTGRTKHGVWWLDDGRRTKIWRFGAMNGVVSRTNVQMTQP